MFDWLEDEMARIKTNKFHLVDGPLSAEQRKLVEQAELPVPPSYKQFVIRFGNAKLYRQGSNYLVRVFAIPVDAESDDGEPLWHFGRTDMALAYFKESLLVPGEESPVFEWRHEQGLQQTASGFEEWLKSKCEASRKLFKKKQWQQIEKGPSPLTEEEQSIVEARRKYRWRVIGITANGDIQFEVHNGSDMVLPFLTIGIRGKYGEVTGGVWLPVSEVMPGETNIIEKGCYKNRVDPQNIIAFEEPDPGPEDREQYWEFEALE